jgi:hypothetical protein
MITRKEQFEKTREEIEESLHYKLDASEQYILMTAFYQGVEWGRKRGEAIARKVFAQGMEGLK